VDKDHGCAATMASNIQDDVGVHGAKINDGVGAVPFVKTPAGGDVHGEVEALCANDIGTPTAPRFDATPGGGGGGDGMLDMRTIDLCFGHL